MALRLAYRALLRSLSYSVTAIATIALTIALATTVFAVVDGVLFKPLPYPAPDRLFTLAGTAGSGISGSASLASLDIQYLREGDPRIGIAAIGGGFPFTHPDQPGVRIWSVGIDSRFFEVLGRSPLVGGFRPGDYTSVAAGAPTPAIVSYGFWQRWLGSDLSAVGRTVPMVGQALVVAGILPRDFVIPVSTLMGQAEILVPVALPPGAENDRWARVLGAIVRLPADVREDEAQARLDAALAAHVSEYQPSQITPGPYVGVVMRSLPTVLTRGDRPMFGVAFSGALLLIILGAINVAGLVGARFRARSTELSVRATLGAGSGSLVGVLLTEAAMVAAAGGALGVLLARPLLTTVVSLLPQTVQLLKTPALDWRVVLFATLASITPVVAFALVPAISSARNAYAWRAAVGHAATPRTRAWGQGALLVAEGAIGVILAVSGSLLLASYVVLRTQDPGLDADDLALVEIQPTRTLTAEARQALEARALERLRRVPGVRDVATIRIPVLEGLYGGSRFAAPTGAAPIMANDVPVSAAFFEIAGLELIDGRFPTRDEIDAARPVAVASDGVARAYWPNRRAVGQELTSPTAGTVTIVGVVKDARLGALNERSGMAEIYLPWGMGRAQWTVYLVKTAGDAFETIRRAAIALRNDVPDVLPRRAESLDSALSHTVRLQQFQTILFGLAGGAGLLLLAVGVAGVVSMNVVRRMRELGVRAALGARPSRLVTTMVLEHVTPSLVGAALGLLVSWWTTRLLRRFLYEVDVHEPLVWAAATGTLVLVAVCAAWLPARRASRVDPMTVLRTE